MSQDCGGVVYHISAIHVTNLPGTPNRSRFTNDEVSPVLHRTRTIRHASFLKSEEQYNRLVAYVKCMVEWTIFFGIPIFQGIQKRNVIMF